MNNSRWIIPCARNAVDIFAFEIVGCYFQKASMEYPINAIAVTCNHNFICLIDCSNLYAVSELILISSNDTEWIIDCLNKVTDWLTDQYIDSILHKRLCKPAASRTSASILSDSRHRRPRTPCTRLRSSVLGKGSSESHRDTSHLFWWRKKGKPNACVSGSSVLLIGCHLGYLWWSIRLAFNLAPCIKTHYLSTEACLDISFAQCGYTLQDGHTVLG